MRRMIKPRTRAIAILTIPVIMVAAAAIACNIPGGSPPTPTGLPADAVNTAAAQTIQAQMTLEESVKASAKTQTSVALTASPLPPEAEGTATPQLTSTPTLTPTPTVPKIKAEVNTNCRRGPSKLYDPPVGILYQDQESEVHGRNDAGTWWYILDPQTPTAFCWVWGETTQVEGNISSLPVVTPPPPPSTPTFTATSEPGFTASFDNVHNCSGDPTAIFEITNTGGSDFDSMELEIEDLTASVTLFGPATSDAPFMGSSGECPEGGDILNVGETLYIGGAIGPGNSGHDARATIELCSENGMSGTCVEETVEFTIP